MDTLEIIPDRDGTADAALEARKAKGRQGAKGCLFAFFLFAMIAIYCCGWLHGFLTTPS